MYRLLLPTACLLLFTATTARAVEFHLTDRHDQGPHRVPKLQHHRNPRCQAAITQAQSLEGASRL